MADYEIVIVPTYELWRSVEGRKPQRCGTFETREAAAEFRDELRALEKSEAEGVI